MADTAKPVEKAEQIDLTDEDDDILDQVWDQIAAEDEAKKPVKKVDDTKA